MAHVVKVPWHTLRWHRSRLSLRWQLCHLLVALVVLVASIALAFLTLATLQWHHCP